jgi:hypothetical protein
MLGGATLAVPGGLKVALYGGAMSMQWLAPPGATPPGLYTYANAVGAFWWLPSFERYIPPATGGAGAHVQLILPLWTLAIAMACIGAVGVWKCRPAKIGLCKECDYDLSGTPGVERCPECGRSIVGKAPHR